MLNKFDKDISSQYTLLGIMRNPLKSKENFAARLFHMHHSSPYAFCIHEFFFNLLILFIKSFIKI